jgi:hypothetical protein
MATPRTVQRVPAGLLYILGMKGGGGVLPSELNGEVQAVADILPLYLREARRALSGGAGGFGADQLVTFASGVVPATELWIVSNITVQVSNLGAATSVWIQPAYYRTSGTVNVFTDTAPVQVAAAGDGINGMAFGFLDLILYPGDGVGCLLSNGVYGVNVTPTMSVDYYRIEI